MSSDLLMIWEGISGVVDCVLKPRRIKETLLDTLKLSIWCPVDFLAPFVKRFCQVKMPCKPTFIDFTSTLEFQNLMIW